MQIRALAAALVVWVVPDACMNAAFAVDLETLVMPGPVIAGHADLENDCDHCHVAFSREKQRSLCLDCHEDVAADVNAGTGHHGRFEEARTAECAACHTDHEGRAADIVLLDTERFDHDLTDFFLTGAHAEIECEDCHAADTKHREAPQACVDCHREDDPHEEGLGAECESCHNTTEWLDTKFDHEAETGYSLTGGHSDVQCAACHVEHRYENTSSECVACHRDDDTHDGLNGSDCALCHVTRSWQESLFDHARETDFALLGHHEKIACADCHTGSKLTERLDSECIACHREDDEHQGLNGPQCGDCHTPADWSAVQFDHSIDTDFALLGRHAEATCADCHIEPAFEVALQTNCYSCHAEDDPHDGEQGEACGQCHNERGWLTEVLFDHALTRFPLVGSHTDTACDACHESQRFRDAPERCVDCHREDDAHQATLGPTCNDCHNPTGWSFWVFDHDQQTPFRLDGAHHDLACGACHTRPVADSVALNSTCASCHRSEDVHRGEFGMDCARCHDTRSFGDARRPF